MEEYVKTLIKVNIFFLSTNLGGCINKLIMAQLIKYQYMTVIYIVYITDMRQQQKTKPRL